MHSNLLWFTSLIFSCVSLGDNVMTAVLDTLATLCHCSHSVSHSNWTVRIKAGFALSHLITIHVRPDSLYNELHGRGEGENSDNCGDRDIYLQAMRGCVATSGDKLSSFIRSTVTSTILSLITTGED